MIDVMDSFGNPSSTHTIGRKSKIIIVSSIQGQKLDQCLDFGASACISTPFSMKEFVTMIVGIGKSEKTNSKIAPVIVDE